jgi:peptide/nickel transport system permease protein
MTGAPTARPRWRRRPHPSGVLGATLLAALLAATLLAPWLSPQGPTEVDLRRRLQPPTWAEPLGTDELGRSTLARVLHGGRVSLWVAVVTVLAAATAGGALGALAGAAPGRLDGLLMRLVDALLICPPLLLALVIIGVLGPGLWPAAVALAIAEAPVFARLVRSVILTTRELPYVEAAVASGARPRRVLLRHVLPAATGVVIVQATVTVGFVVVALAGLGFLGLGVQPPAADWGDMLARARNHLPAAPWLMLAPGAAVTATVLGANLLGDALRDALADHGGAAAGALVDRRAAAARPTRGRGSPG